VKPQPLSPKNRPFYISLGDRGEMIAWNYLRQRGYKILEKNYRCRLGEIDIVAKRSRRIVFIEVKTRSDGRFGTPGESVHVRKQKKLARLAQWYLKEKKIHDVPISFDVVSVLWDQANPQIQLIQDAFSMEETFI